MCCCFSFYCSCSTTKSTPAAEIRIPTHALTKSNLTPAMRMKANLTEKTIPVSAAVLCVKHVPVDVFFWGSKLTFTCLCDSGHVCIVVCVCVRERYLYPNNYSYLIEEIS